MYETPQDIAIELWEKKVSIICEPGWVIVFRKCDVVKCIKEGDFR